MPSQTRISGGGVLRARAAGAIAIALLAALPDQAATQAPAPGAAAPVRVGTVAVEARPVARALTVTGRVEGIDRVELRARIDGFLEEVSFVEGQQVAEGDLLYRIERGLFEAAVAVAEGDRAQARAEKELADIELDRAEKLLARQVGTAEARDVAKAGADRAAGALIAAEAALARARINLGYTEIRAPVAGRIGRTALTRGAVVGPASGVLATLVSQDPMHVTFPVSARELLRPEGAGERVPPSEVRVRLRFLEGSTYAHEGRIDFVDVTVDRATDTVLARSTIANPDRALIDGQLVTVILEAGTPTDRVVVPQAALIADQGGVYVLAVVEGRAAVRRIRTAGMIGPDIVVTEGLAAGDLVIVEGIEHARPGAPVLASPVEPDVKAN